VLPPTRVGRGVPGRSGRCVAAPPRGRTGRPGRHGAAAGAPAPGRLRSRCHRHHLPRSVLPRLRRRRRRRGPPRRVPPPCPASSLG